MRTKNEVAESLAICEDNELKGKIVSYGTFENSIGKGFVFIVRTISIDSEREEYLKRITGCKKISINRTRQSQIKILLSDMLIPQIAQI